MAADPSLDHFNWALVKSFVAVLDAGSLMGAARRLGAQQPTLSRHIAELEAQLKVPLFERTGRGVTPTAAALAIADAARQMQGSAATLQRALAQRTAATSGTVRITTSEVAASYLLPGVLARLQQAEPGIALELVASNELTNLLRREADIAVRMVRPAQSSLVARKLGETRMVPCASPGYLERHGTPRTPDDLQQHNCLTTNDLQMNWEYKGPDGKRGMVRVSGHYACDNWEVLREWALAGLGVADGQAAARILGGEVVWPDLPAAASPGNP